VSLPAVARSVSTVAGAAAEKVQLEVAPTRGALVGPYSSRPHVDLAGQGVQLLAYHPAHGLYLLLKLEGADVYDIFRRQPQLLLPEMCTDCLQVSWGHWSW
jgi:hypothetical protein